MFIHFNVEVAACKICKIKCFNLSKITSRKKLISTKLKSLVIMTGKVLTAAGQRKSFTE